MNLRDIATVYWISPVLIMSVSVILVIARPISYNLVTVLCAGTLEPTYRQLQTMKLDKSPFVIISVIGQELLAQARYPAAVTVLESALKIGTCSLKLRGSVFSALSSAYWALNTLDKVRNLRINYNKLLIVTLLVSRIRCGVRQQINLIRARCLSISGPMQCQSDQQAPLSTKIKTVKSLHCQLTADTFDCFGFYVNG